MMNLSLSSSKVPMQWKSASILPNPKQFLLKILLTTDPLKCLSSAAGIMPQLLKSVDVIFNTIAVIHARDRSNRNCFVKAFPTGTFIRALIANRLQWTKHFPATQYCKTD
jgi:hypothetical protein